MNIYVYHNRQLLYNGPAPAGVGMLEFVPGCVADTCGDIDLTRYEVKRIGFTLNGSVAVWVQERAQRIDDAIASEIQWEERLDHDDYLRR